MRKAANILFGVALGLVLGLAGRALADAIADRTLVPAYVDASGTPGPATINAVSGRAAVAATASSVTITDNKVSATSTVLVEGEALQGTHLTYVVVPTAGSFTLTLDTAANPAYVFRFFVIN